MSSFYAELRVAGRVYVIRLCEWKLTQATDTRGRVIAKVRHGKVYITLDVPNDTFLEYWANAPFMPLPGCVVFFQTKGSAARETLSWEEGHCVGYREEFQEGSSTTGSYVCHLVIAAPKLTMSPGGPPQPFVAPAPREHGTPPQEGLLSTAAVPTAAAISGLPPHLPAPVPAPSPDHQQVHLTAAEWQTLTAGRWDRQNNKSLFQPHRNTEFHVAGDPHTYRTDAKGKVVAVYDARKSYNVTGSRKGLSGIPLTLNGEPTYAGTPHLFPVTGTQQNVVQIEMAGNRPGDFKRANEAAGLADLVKLQGLDADEAPEGYTWHHRDDFIPKSPPNPPYGTCTMELVKGQAHRDTFVHYGSCDQCNKHNNKQLYK